jgi:hypothetical protein
MKWNHKLTLFSLLGLQDASLSTLKLQVTSLSTHWLFLNVSGDSW